LPTPQAFDLAKFDQYVAMRDFGDKLKGAKELICVLERQMKGERAARVRLWKEGSRNFREERHRREALAVHASLRGDVDGIREQMSSTHVELHRLREAIAV